MPDQETYHGRHVHAALDGSSYSVYRFSEPDGISFTYYETPEFASNYDYATGEYTEWLQDFYGEVESDLLQWYANAYVADDSEDIDDFNAEMGTDHIFMDAYYDSEDNIVVTITSDKNAFYASYVVGDEDNAEITYGDASDSGDNYNDFYQTFELWYTYYDIDGNQFEVHNYFNDNGLNGNEFIQVVDGESIDTYYQWYDNLSEDLYNNDGMGYSVSNSYDNEVYVTSDNYQAYYFLSDDASYSYYLSEFYADDGTYRSTEGNDSDLVSYYKSADGYFESYYTWMTQTYVTFYNDFYSNYVSDDGSYGEYLYEDPSKTYWVSGSWSITVGVYSWSETDSYGENISGT